MPRPGRRAAALALIGLVGTSLAACSGGAGSTAPTSSATSVPTSSATTTPASTSTATRTSAPGAATSTRSSTTSPTAAPALACARRLVGAMTRTQRAGQLVWPALDASAGAHGLDSTITGRAIGGVFYLGGWSSGAATVGAASRHLQTLSQSVGGHRIGLFVAADQEGGEVQQLRGPGFSTLPSARQQDANTPAQQRAAWTRWGRELAAAGVNLNLAPVADTVPASLGTGNGPIGRYDRQFSSDPVDNARMVAASVEGMHTGGIGTTIKHFPGIGRIRENTDTSATGITDTETTATSSYLQPFAAGIAAGTDVVMVSSAQYSELDPDVTAAFSRPIVTGLLRERLGFSGVVMSDDLGVARAVASVPLGERATRFVAAGGDVVLTASPSAVAPMTGALTQRYASSTSFRQQVDAAAARVVALKVTRGLASCS